MLETLTHNFKVHIFLYCMCVDAVYQLKIKENVLVGREKKWLSSLRKRIETKTPQGTTMN